MRCCFQNNFEIQIEWYSSNGFKTFCTNWTKLAIWTHNLSPFDSKSLTLYQSTFKMKQQICISPEPGVLQFRQWHQVGWMLASYREVEFNFLVWSSIAQSDFEPAFSLLESGFLRCHVRILVSPEEVNLSLSIRNHSCVPEQIQNQTKNMWYETLGRPLSIYTPKTLLSHSQRLHALWCSRAHIRFRTTSILT